jgi:hypothetical protein
MARHISFMQLAMTLAEHGLVYPFKPLPGLQLHFQSVHRHCRLAYIDDDDQKAATLFTKYFRDAVRVSSLLLI